MKKVFGLLAALVIVSMMASSCGVARDSDCPSHDPNFFRKSYRR